MDFSKEKEQFRDDEQYYSDFEYVTNSQLGWFDKSISFYEYRRKYADKFSPTQPMIFGDAFHKSILEPDKFKETFVMAPNVDRRTKKGKEEWSEFILSLSPHQKALTANEYDDIYIMSDIIMSDREASGLLSNGVAEDVAVWKDPQTGVLCKGKADYVGQDYIVDLKTTRDCSIQGFLDSCKKYGYFRQSAFYCDAFGVTTFYFIAIEKTSPYIMNIFMVHPKRLDDGRFEYQTILTRYKKYLDGTIESNIIVL